MADHRHNLNPVERGFSFRFMRRGGVRWGLALGVLLMAVGAEAGDLPGLTEQINAEIRRGWDAGNVKPAAPADDAAFLRRVSLHLSGSIPPVSVVREFLADKSPDKRQRYVDSLLDGPEYVANFARVWQAVMLPNPGEDFGQGQISLAFEYWLQQQLAAGTSYDEMVRQILVPGADPNSRFGRVVNGRVVTLQEGSPLAFSDLRQSTPENMASASVRVFLGVRLECAQCHDHPFDRWKQDEFWSIAAFFAPPKLRGESSGRDAPQRSWSIKIPGTERVVPAAYLDGSAPTSRPDVSGRALLAQWITSRDNPRFATTAVNRIWGHLFGVGLVEPLDDFSDHNLPSHPELLNHLAREFVEHDFDVKFLIRAITASEAYQLSSVRTDPSQDDVRRYGRTRTQGLTADELLANFRQATGQRSARRFAMYGQQEIAVRFDGNDLLFPPNSGSVLEQETSILQALMLMNGQLPAMAVSQQFGPGTFAAIASNPFMSLDERIESLYLATLTRFPTEAERTRAREFCLKSQASAPRNNAFVAAANGLTRLFSGTPAQPVTSGPVTSGPVTSGVGPSENAGLANLFWVLLNSSEFQLNH